MTARTHPALTKPPGSIEEIREIISKAFLQELRGEDEILKTYFDAWYQLGFVWEFSKFKKACDDLRPSRKREPQKEYWWEKY